MNFFLFFGICVQKTNICTWLCSESPYVWQLSQILLPMDFESLGENEKQSLICGFFCQIAQHIL